MILTTPDYESEEKALTAVRALNPLLYKAEFRGKNYTIAIIMDTFHPSTTEGYILRQVRIGGRWPEGQMVWKWFKMTPLQGPDLVTEEDPRYPHIRTNVDGHDI